MIPQRFLPIGRVIRPHGIRGRMKVEYFGEDPDRFSVYREVLIEDPTGALKRYEVVEAIPQPPRLLVCLKGIDRIEDVLPLAGKEILVPRESLPPPEKDEYYWFEIVGMVVKTVEGRVLGSVKRIFSTGAHDVYVVEGKRDEIYLPATEEVIRKIDREEGEMEVQWMEGLWEKEDEV